MNLVGYADACGSKLAKTNISPPRPVSQGPVRTPRARGSQRSQSRPSRRKPHVDITFDPETYSEGSKLHGMEDDLGVPKCQPCAWFHKPFGCYHGTACVRCHLCPPGESKFRKKQKIARLRQEEDKAMAAKALEAATWYGPSDPSDPSDPSAYSPAFVGTGIPPFDCQDYPSYESYDFDLPVHLMYSEHPGMPFRTETANLGTSSLATAAGAAGAEEQVWHCQGWLQI